MAAVFMVGMIPLENPSRTCIVLCMDKRIRRWWFFGWRMFFRHCYWVCNAGPRIDALRSVRLFVELHSSSPDKPVYLVWLSHDSVCACSKRELAPETDPELIEHHTRLKHIEAIDTLRHDPVIGPLIEDGSVILRSGEIQLCRISVQWDCSELFSAPPSMHCQSTC